MTLLSRRISLLIALSIGLIVGVGYPVVMSVSRAEYRIPKRAFGAKAYFPLTIGVSVVMLGGMAMGLVYAVLMWCATVDRATMPPNSYGAPPLNRTELC